MSNSKLNILLAGESWITHGIHVKGFASYTTGSYEEGHQPLSRALLSAGHNLTYITNHEATEKFPNKLEELKKYNIVILSDLPADTLLLHNDTFLLGKQTPNRLKLLVEYVQQGGGFLMVGGYMSFTGFQAKANYYFSPLVEVLPVEMYNLDDRIEAPEGVYPDVVNNEHPVIKGIPQKWPVFLGYNKLKPGNGDVIMTCQGDPFLVVGKFGKGRSAAFASDCSPHWAPEEFMNWKYYPIFWNQLMSWLANKS